MLDDRCLMYIVDRGTVVVMIRDRCYLVQDERNHSKKDLSPGRITFSAGVFFYFLD